jgi:hypothetical protein
MVLMDRLIPFLAAFVGLIALGGAVLVQVNNQGGGQQFTQELAALRAEVDALARRADVLAATDESLAAADNDGTIDAMLALQDRMNRLETDWANRPAPTLAGDAPTGGYRTADGDAEVNPDWPTDNCIPLGTRFMAAMGDSIPICQSPVVVTVAAITGDTVMVEGAGVVNETASQIIPGSNCNLMVYSADAEGFAEMRVACN